MTCGLMHPGIYALSLPTATSSFSSHNYAGSTVVADLVASMGEVAHCDASIAAHLWALVFPIVWATLSERKEQQIQLAKPIIGLLSKEYHIRQVCTGLRSAFHLVFSGGDVVRFQGIYTQGGRSTACKS